MDESIRVPQDRVISYLEQDYASRLPQICAAMRPLLESSKIVVYKKTSGIRGIQLRTQELFDNLVSLYENMFMEECFPFQQMVEDIPSSSDLPLQPQLIAARTYVSMWFIDLYVSNRNALRLVAGNEPVHAYIGRMDQVSSKYDSFLAILIKWIRPVHVSDALNNNDLYFPVLAQDVKVQDPNPFGIVNFMVNRKVFHQLIEAMQDANRWRLTDVEMGNGNGRNLWLFDWHNENQLCPWFPSKSISFPEVMLAYILGTPCTKNLGVKDEDVWQFFPGGVVPPNPNPVDYERITPRRVLGMHRVRELVIDYEYRLLGISVQDQVKAPRFKIVEWLYYYPVYGIQLDFESRVKALKTILTR